MSALDAAAIVAHLAPAARARLRDVEVLDKIDSTNAELLRRGEAHFALLAESQSAGRGRRGRVWTSPRGANLYLSLSWRVAQPAGLSLALGIACAEALRDGRVRVKWPNDLVADGRKLGGLLIEMSGTLAVIGLGLNVRMPADVGIDQPWIDLAQLGHTASRNELAARLLDVMTAALVQFDAQGLAPFLPRWAALDALADREIAILANGQTSHGIARGIAADGGLRVDTDAGERVLHSAEVSVRDAAVRTAGVSSRDAVAPAKAGAQ